MSDTPSDLRREIDRCSAQIDALFHDFRSSSDALNKDIDKLKDQYNTLYSSAKQVIQDAEEIKEAKDNIKSHEKKLNILAKNFNNLSKTTDKAVEDINSLKETSDNHGTQLNELNEFKNSEEERLSKLKNEIVSELKQDYNAKFDKLKSNIEEKINNEIKTVNDSIQKAYSDLLGKHNDNAKLIEQHTAYFQQINTFVNGLKDRIDKLETSMNKAESRLDNHDSQLQKHSSELQKHDEHFGAIDHHLEEIDISIESLRNEISGLQDTTIEIKKQNEEDTAAWKQRTDEIEHSAKKHLKSAVSALKSQIDETNTKLSDLTNNFTQFSDQTTKNFADVKRETDELRADNEALEKDCHTTLDEINKKNADMRATLDQSNKKLEDMNLRIKFLQGDEKISMTDLSGQIQSVRTTLTDTVDGFNDTVQKIRKESKETAAKTISEVDAKIASVNESIDKLVDDVKAALSKQKETILTKVEAGDNQTNEKLDNEIKRVDKLIGGSTETMDSLTKSIGGLRDSLSKMNQEYKDSDDKINTALQNSINEVESKRQKLESKFDQVKSETSAQLDSVTNQVVDRLERFKEKISSQNEKIEASKTEMLEKIQEVVDQNTQTKTDVDNKIEQIKVSIEENEQQTAKNIDSIKSELHEDVRTQVSAVNADLTETKHILMTLKGENNYTMDDLAESIKKVKTCCDEKITNNKQLVEQRAQELITQMETYNSSTDERIKAVNDGFAQFTEKNRAMIEETANKLEIEIQTSKKELSDKNSTTQSALDNFIGGITSTMPQVLERIASIENNTAEELANSNKSIKKIKEKFGELSLNTENSLNASKENIANIEATLNTKFDALSSQVKDLKTKNAADKDELMQEIDKSSAKVKKYYEENVETQKQRDAKQEADIEALHQNIADAETRINSQINVSIEQSEKSISNRINKLKGAISTLDERLTALTGTEEASLPGLMKRVSAVEVKMGELDENHAQKIEKQQDEIVKMINDLKADSQKQFADIHTEMKTGFDEGKATNDTIISSFKDRISKLSSTSKENYSQLSAAIEAIKGGSNSSINDLSQRIEDVYHKTDAQLQAHENDIKQQNEKTQKLSKEVSDAVTANLRAEIAGVRDDTARINDSLNKLDAKVKEIPNKNDYGKIVNRLNLLQGESTETIPLILQMITETRQSVTSAIDECKADSRLLMKTFTSERDDILNNAKTAIFGATITLAQAEAEINKLRDATNNNVQKIDDFADQTIKKIKEMSSTIKANNNDSVANITKLNNTLTELDSKVTQNAKLIETELQTEVTNLKNASIKDKADLRQSMAENQQEVKDAIKVLSIKVDEEDTKVETYREWSRKKVSSIEEFNKAIKQQLDDHIEENIHQEEARKIQAENDLANKHNEISQEVESIIKAHSKDIENAANAQSAKFAKEISDIKDQINQIKGGSEASIAQTMTKIDHLKSNFKQNAKQISETFESVQNDFHNSLTQIQSDNSAKFAEINERFKSSDDKSSQIEQKFNEKVQSCRNDFGSQISQSEQRAKEYIDKVAAQESNDVKTMHAALTKSIEDEANNNNALAQRISDLKQALENSQAEQQTNLDSFMMQAAKKVKEQISSAINQQSGSLESIKEEIASSQKEIEEQIEQVKKDMTEMKTNVDNKLAENTNSMNKSINENRARISQSEDKVKETLEAFKQRVSSAEENIGSVEVRVQEMQSDVSERVKKVENSIKNIKEVTRSQLEDMQKVIEKDSQDNQQNIAKLQEDTKKSFSDLAQKNEENITTKIAEINSVFDKLSTKITADVSNMQTKIRNDIGAMESELNQLKEADTQMNARIDKLEKNVDQNNKYLNNSLDDVTKRVNKIDTTTTEAIEYLKSENSRVIKSAERLEKAFDDISTNFDTLRNGTNALQRRCDTEIDSMKGAVEKATTDIASLQHIHRHNANFESFNMKFEQTLASIQEFQNNVCSLIFPSLQSIPAINSAPSVSPAKSTVSQKVPRIPKKDRFVVQVSDGEEVGQIARRALQEYQHVMLQVASRAKLTWTRIVHISPMHSLTIVCDDMDAEILVNGCAKIGEMMTPVRCIVDGVGILRLLGVRIIAKTQISDLTHMQDFTGLFVLRSFDAAGPSVATIRGCDIESDVAIVNAGGSANAHVEFSETRIASSARAKGQPINPVTANSGGFEQGFAYLSTKDLKISDRQVVWLDSQYIITETTE